MKTIISLTLLLATLALAQAEFVVYPWVPIFKGIEHATGTNAAATYGTLAANALRIDLHDPDIRLFTTPAMTNNYIVNQRETVLQKPGEFLKAYRLQVAINASHYSPGSYSNPSGTPSHIHGLAISEGDLVSPQSSTNDALSSMLFTTNNEAFFLPLHWPATNTAGIFTAVAGMFPVLVNGVNISYAYTNARNDTIHQPQPRTAFGLSQDRRYLILLTIDGRQGDYSDGALDWETAEFLLRFGAWDGMNMDGGGSTCMVMADICGNPVALNQNSFQFAVNRPGDQRPTGSNLGVRAKALPGFINDLEIIPGDTQATVTWTSLAEATSQVEYGLTPVPDRLSPLNPTPATNHSIVITDLTPSTQYYVRAVSQTETETHSADSCFTTTNLAGEIAGAIFPLTHSWRYQWANLDGANWTAPGYDDANWPSGPGLLCVENNPQVNPKSTVLPSAPDSYPYVTYYFRTEFDFTNSPAGATLTFSNFLDDGAVFYLNGVEIHRAFLPAPPAVIYNTTTAIDYNCKVPSPGGDATCPYVFSIGGSVTTNLVEGVNVLAVEVHNYNVRSPDIVFGTALFYTAPPPVPPPPFISGVTVEAGETTATITWTTRSNATSQVEYGPTTSLGLVTPLDPVLVTNHLVTLTGLSTKTPYYFRVVSTVSTNTYLSAGEFTTVAFYEPLLALTNSWRYTTNDLDGQNWTSPAYSDDSWLGEGPALLYIENNNGVYPRNTLLPSTGTPLPRTYYFRTHLTITNPPAGYGLLFSNYVDDGAVFYLNGVEIGRIRMNPALRPVYADFATGNPPSNDAVFPDLFRIGGAILTNLLVGDNVLAVEVHQSTASSPDIVFGSSVGYVRATVDEMKMRVTQNNGVVCLVWEGVGFTLQQAAHLNDPAAWSDVPGPVQTSPFCKTNPPATTFYRLRN